MTEEEFESLADGSWKYEIESLREELEELRIQLKQERQDHGHNIRQLKITASEMLKGKDEQLENCRILMVRIENERNAIALALETENVAATRYAQQMAYWIERHDVVRKERDAALEKLDKIFSNECKNGGECGVGGYCDDCYQPLDELNLLRTQVRDLRHQRDAALKTDQEPVGYAHYEKGRLVLLCRNDASMDMFPLYTHPAPVVSSEPVAWMMETTHKTSGEKSVWISTDRKGWSGMESVIYGEQRPLYTHPARTLSDEEILEIWNSPKWTYLTSATVLAFARAVLEKAK